MKKARFPSGQMRRLRALTLSLARCGGALLTTACIVLAFPTPDLGWLAWVALVPLLLACEGLGPGAASAIGLLSGVVTSFGIYRWLFEVPGFNMRHAQILALYVGSYTAAWCAGLPLLRRSRLPLLITATAWWVALDYLQAHAGFLALPWATLAHSQHKNLAVLQMAALTGEAGVTFLVVMGNVAMVGIIAQRAWRSAIATGLVIALAHAGGFLALAWSDSRPTVRVGVVQPSILRSELRSPASRLATLERLERLTGAAAATRPALIAWPETAVPDLRKDPSLIARLQGMADKIQTPLVVGASEVEKFTPREGQFAVRIRAHNSAYLIAPGASLGEPYRKMRLLPFGEYLPLEGIVKWPAWLVPKMYDIVPGEARGQFTLADGTRVGVLICWENLFADFVRPAVRDGAQLLVQLTNDAWFGRTGAPHQHNLASVLRAVENRTPVVIASNTGPSQIIDPYGRVVASVPVLFSEGVATAAVALGSGGTPYTRFGDLFAVAVLACLVLAMIIGPVQRLSVQEAAACPDAGVRPINEPTHR